MSDRKVSFKKLNKKKTEPQEASAVIFNKGIEDLELLENSNNFNTSYLTLLQNSYDISKYNQSNKPDLDEKNSPKNDCFTINVNKLNQSLDLIPFHDFFTNELRNNSLDYYFNTTLTEQFRKEAAENIERYLMKKSNKLNILDNFEYLNIVEKQPEIKPDDKLIVIEKPRKTETIEDFLDDLLN